MTMASTPTDSVTLMTDSTREPSSPANAMPVATLDATSAAPIAASSS